MPPRTFYEVLDIPADATLADVESGYLRALEAFSGDALASYALFTPDEAARVREEIETAYAVLRQSERRAQYDAALRQSPEQAAALTLTFETHLPGHLSSSTTSVSDLSVSPPRREEPSGVPAPASSGAAVASAGESAEDPGTPPTPMVPDVPNTDPERRTPTALVIAPAVEEAHAAAPPLEPSAPEELPPLPPAAAEPTPVEPPAATLAVPTSVPVSLGPTDPPPAPRFKRVRADDSTTAVQVARAVQRPSTTPPPKGHTPPGGGAPVVDLSAEGEINGAVLQRLRESRGMTLREMSDRTKVSVHYLKAMEANAFNELPSRVYLRGFLIHYARALGVSPERMAAGYLAFAERFRGGVVR